jgi:hypothetical protein
MLFEATNADGAISTIEAGIPIVGDQPKVCGRSRFW